SSHYNDTGILPNSFAGEEGYPLRGFTMRLLGLCNNFAYVVMLSAAHDILKQQGPHNSTPHTPSTVALDVEGGKRSRYDCSPVSTAVNRDKLHLFLLVTFSSSVIFASVSAGLGELSFLSLTVFFSRDVLGGWGSGTGGAGVAGALLYSGLTQAGLSPRNTLLIMLVVPVAMVISYFFLLVFPPSFPQWKCREVESVRGRDSQSRQPLLDDTDEEEEREKGAEGVFIMSGLLRFVVPLGVVYFAKYFINQGLLLTFFVCVCVFRYQTLYQVGVLVSRSSLCCVKFRRIWCVNAVLLLLSVYYQFLPSAWLVFVIVLYEGLLGGATGDRQREFAMVAASVGDCLGIVISGLIAFPVHRYFCSL
uniref:Battenin n=1 Tax=Oncorhynchus kisutch TaxID=8019 RepID=A0A8C7IJ65_ONCKI